MAQDIVIDGPESFASASHVSRETLADLIKYEALLNKWQASINLVSSATLSEVWKRHFWDSAQLLPMVPPETINWVDLGSGAGFPGLVMALLLRDRPGFHMHLIESDQRKSVFLREAARLINAPITVHTIRVEQFQPEQLPDVVSARAFAPLNRIFALSHSFWGKQTLGLFLKGASAPDELTGVGKEWIFKHQVSSSLSDPSGYVLKIWELRHAGY